MSNATSHPKGVASCKCNWLYVRAILLQLVASYQWPWKQSWSLLVNLALVCMWNRVIIVVVVVVSFVFYFKRLSLYLSLFYLTWCCHGYRINTTFEMFTHIPDIVPFTVQIDGSNLGTTGQVGWQTCCVRRQSACFAQWNGSWQKACCAVL